MGCGVMPVFFAFVVLSFMLTVFVSDVAMVLFLTTMAVRLTMLLGFGPIPVVLTRVFYTGLNNSTAVYKSPPGVVVKASLKCAFVSFMAGANMVTFTSLKYMLMCFCLIFGGSLRDGTRGVSCDGLPAPRSTVASGGNFVVDAIVFLMAMMLLMARTRAKLAISTVNALITVMALTFSKGGTLVLLGGMSCGAVNFFVNLFIMVKKLRRAKVLRVMTKFVKGVDNKDVIIVLTVVL